MSPKTLWPFFHCGELWNSVHHTAYEDEDEDLEPAAAIMAEKMLVSSFLGACTILCINLIAPSMLFCWMLDDGEIEIPSDEEYNGWYFYVPKILDIYLVCYRKNHLKFNIIFI
jgi:hypothetical protein